MVGSREPDIAKIIKAPQWKVLVAAPTPSSKQADFQEQKKLLAAVTVGLRERNVQVVYLLHGELVPNEELYLQQHSGLRLKGFELVLIDRDGNIKLHSPHPVTPEALFGTIDRMATSEQAIQ